MIAFQQVDKWFDTVRVLRQVSFVIQSQEVVGLSGDSGAGKTTVLRLIAGLTAPDAGHINVDSTAKLSYMFQEPRLLPWCTAVENVTVVARAAGIADAKSAAYHWLEQVGLDTFAGHYPAQLSGGMQQRVALARSLVVQPDLLLLDEPFSSVDDARKHDLIAILQDAIRQNGSTVLYVTHDLSELQCMTTRTLHLHRGAMTSRVN